MSTPFADTRRPPGKRAKPLRHGLGALQIVAITALVAGTATATLAVWQHAEGARYRDHRAHMALAVDDVQLRLEAELEDLANVIADAELLFSGAEPVSPATFDAFVSGPRREGGAPYGVGFAQRVRSAEFDAFLAAIRADRGQAFSVRQPPDGAEAAVVLHGGEAFGAAVGFDALADPQRRKALERARDTGRPAVSRRAVLLPGPDHARQQQEMGLVVYSPVYRGDEPRTLRDRRANLAGWTGVPFRPGEILREIEAQLPLPLELELAEVGSAEPPLAGTVTGRRPDSAAAMATVDVYGATWGVGVHPGPGFTSGSFDPRLILAGGMAAAAALAAQGLALLRGRSGRGTTRHHDCLTDSEAHLRAAVSSLSDLIVLVDADGTIVFASEQARPLLGHDPERLVGQPVEMLIPERSRAAHARHRIGSVAAEGKRPMGASTELQVLRADGNEVPVVIALSPVKGPDGTPLTAAVVRRAADRPVSDEQELLANVANFSNDAILTVDLCGWVTSWNVGAEALYGWSTAEAIGRHISFIVPREHHEEAAATLARARSGEAVASRATVRMRRGGDPVDVSVAESPIRDRSGRITGVSSISRDIAEEQAARESLLHYATELERSKRDLEEYATVTAHDLSEPLRVVGCSADLLRARYSQGRSLDEAGIHHLEGITAGVERMRQLIERVLALSQLRSDRRDHGPVDLTAVLDEVCTSLHPLVEEAGAEFFPADLPVVWGDRAQLTLLMENLVSNALKYRHPGRTLRIVVGATSREKDWTISVSDNGLGIDPAFHERIFGMFRRVHAPETSEETGIGLALCRQIVNLHGGEIRVESEPGRGSVFTFTLPARPAELKREAAHTRKPARAQGGVGSVPIASGGAQPTSAAASGRRFVPAGRVGREPAVSTNVLVEERSRAQRDRPAGPTE